MLSPCAVLAADSLVAAVAVMLNTLRLAAATRCDGLLLGCSSKSIYAGLCSGRQANREVELWLAYLQRLASRIRQASGYARQQPPLPA